MIDVQNLSMFYPSKKGIEDVSFTVNAGEIFGYLGPNGAGKTTTIRCLMGFLKAQQGQVKINNKDCWEQASLIQKEVGYLPGEIAFFDEMSGRDFLNFQMEMKGIKDKVRMNYLLDLFEMNPNSSIRKMSKGMKQKLGLITAFIDDPMVYIFDEPTSGLDPLMQQVFVSLIMEEKKRGKTVLMSSHSFEEVEKTCDRIAMIRNGRIAVVEDIGILRQQRRKVFSLTVSDLEDITLMKRLGLELVQTMGLKVDVAVVGDFETFFNKLKTINIVDLDVKTQRLEEVFMQYYGKENSK